MIRATSNPARSGLISRLAKNRLGRGSGFGEGAEMDGGIGWPAQAPGCQARVHIDRRLMRPCSRGVFRSQGECPLVVAKMEVSLGDTGIENGGFRVVQEIAVLATLEMLDRPIQAAAANVAPDMCMETPHLTARRAVPLARRDVFSDLDSRDLRGFVAVRPYGSFRGPCTHGFPLARQTIDAVGAGVIGVSSHPGGELLELGAIFRGMHVPLIEHVAHQDTVAELGDFLVCPLPVAVFLKLEDTLIAGDVFRVEDPGVNRVRHGFHGRHASAFGGRRGGRCNGLGHDQHGYAKDRGADELAEPDPAFHGARRPLANMTGSEDVPQTPSGSPKHGGYIADAAIRGKLTGAPATSVCAVIPWIGDVPGSPGCLAKRPV